MNVAVLYIQLYQYLRDRVSLFPFCGQNLINHYIRCNDVSPSINLNVINLNVQIFLFEEYFEVHDDDEDDVSEGDDCEGDDCEGDSILWINEHNSARSTRAKNSSFSTIFSVTFNPR